LNRFKDGSIEKVRVTNTYNPNTTEIGVTKNWSVTDESSIANYAVTARLWKHVVDDANAGTYKEVQVSGDADDTSFDVKDLILTASGNWSGTWTGLDALTGTDEYYYVKEVQVADTSGTEAKVISDQFLVTYSNNELSTSGTATITNTEKTEISVTKKWLAFDGTTELTEGYSDSISVTLRQRVTTTTEGVTTISYVDVETITLGADNKDKSTDTGSYDFTGWTYTWTSLPIGIYCVNESSVEDYTTTYQIGADATTQYNNGNNAYTTDGNIIITNTKEETAAPTEISITVDKKWVYEDETDKEVTDADLLPASVTVALYYSTTSPDTLTSGNVYPSDLEPYIPAGETEALTATLTADDNWTCTWSNLPISGTDVGTGNEVSYYYYVKETAVGSETVNSKEQIYSTNGLSETGTVTVTNKVASTSISVTKKWLDASGAQLSAIPDTWSVDLQLYQWVADTSLTEGGSWNAYGDIITLFAQKATDSSGNVLDRKSTDDWTYMWTHLPSGQYYIEEINTTASGSFTIGYRTATMTSTEVNLTVPSEAKCTVTAGSSDSDSGTITVVNQKESTQISVEKVWKNSDGTVDTDQAETVTMYLYRTTEPLTEAETLAITSTVENATYTSGEVTSTAVITCSGEMGDFKSVTVDGVTLTEDSDYTLTSGSTIITFTKAYLETLSEGVHAVVLKYNTLGTIETTLKVIKAAKTETETATEAHTESATETSTEKGTESVTESEKQTETTQSETSTEKDTEAEPETTTMNVTINVVWVDANGNSCTAPSDGYEWVGIHPYSDSSTIDWNTNKAGNLSGSENWTATYTLPASSTENGVTTYYKYRLQYNGQICTYDSAGTATVIGTVSDTTQFDISGNGDAEQIYTITAKIVDSSGSQTENETSTETNTEKETQSGSGDEDVGSWTVTVYASNNDTSYSGGLVTNNNVTSSSITVLILFDYKPEVTLSVDATGVTVTSLGYKTYADSTYAVFEINGISGDCDFTLYPESAYPKDSGSLILEGTLTWNDETVSIQSYGKNLTASLITLPHTLTTSGVNGTSQTTSETEIEGFFSADETTPYAEITLGTSYTSESGYDNGGLSYTWNDLDKYDENGNLYYYYIVEKAVDGYTSSYSTDVKVTTTTSTSGLETETTTTINKVTVTNTKDITPISVTVKKDWNGYESGVTDGYIVTATLVQVDSISGTESDVVTVNLGSAYAGQSNYDTDGWSYTRNGLDASYSYYVKEVSVKDSSGTVVNNFTTSYLTTECVSTETASAAKLSGTGTITITNTKKSGQGIVMPGTGSKYSLVFYGLGLSFLVISATWMLYAFKKKKYKYAGKGGAKSDSS